MDIEGNLIEDIVGDDTDNIIDCIMEVYFSWIDNVISNYNTDFYYQSRMIFRIFNLNAEKTLADIENKEFLIGMASKLTNSHNPSEPFIECKKAF